MKMTSPHDGSSKDHQGVLCLNHMASVVTKKAIFLVEHICYSFIPLCFYYHFSFKLKQTRTQRLRGGCAVLGSTSNNSISSLFIYYVECLKDNINMKSS
mmetsp:Transcript_42993/g.70418  ORF Transcript_42993/g.70418 Transcript_42993/m.70418 type:complete len:99 (-) Transcript_42993:5642-5938(-)